VICIRETKLSSQRDLQSNLKALFESFILLIINFIYSSEIVKILILKKIVYTIAKGLDPWNNWYIEVKRTGSPIILS